jgi:hypothetical protein
MDFLTLEPDKELEFVGPFTVVSKQTLVVKNADPTSPIAFKVKTTAPKQYCVRPNAGRIPPGESCEIQVLLQAFKEEPPTDFKPKDKFLIQAIKITDDLMQLDNDQAALKILDLWSQAEKLKKDSQDLVCEKKLRCVFVFVPVADRAPSIKSTVSAPVPASNQLSTSAMESSPLGMGAIDEKKQSIQDVNSKESADTVKSLQTTVNQYKAEIDRLNSGIRQRKDNSKTESSVSHPETKMKLIPKPFMKSKSAMPVEWVVILALFSFILGFFLARF